MRNVEFKAEIRDLEAARLTCEVVGAVRAGTLVQVDTYFRTPDGRLKRRETEGQPPEWIFYQRPDQPGPRLSRYTLLTDGQARVRFGSGTLQAWKVVRKRREPWLLDSARSQTRIHLDEVEGLGTFLEIEALVTPGRDLPEACVEVLRLRGAFSPLLGEPIAGSYGELAPELPPDADIPSLP
jgi:adenylate cyclase class IV